MLSWREQTITKAAAALIVVCAWSALLLLLWNLDRGFDFTDEANLLYLYRHPDAFLEGRQLQHFGFIRALVPDSFDHVVIYRSIKLAGLIGLTAAFGLVLCRWAARRFGFLSGYLPRPIVLVHFLALGSFLAYCHGSQTLSYNDVVTFCLLGVAIALMALDLCPARWRRARWCFLVSCPAGAICLLAFFTKWSAGILLAAYFCLFVALVREDRNWRTMLAALAGAACGAAAFALVFTDAGVRTALSFAKLFAAFADQASVQEHGGAAQLLRQYVETTVGRLGELLRSPVALALVTLPFLAAVARANIAGAARGRLWVNALGCALVVSLGIFISEAPAWARDNAAWFNRFKIADLQTFAAIFAFLAACCCVPVAAKMIERRRLVMLLSAAAMMALLAAVGAIGTNNALLTQFIRHMGPLFAALALLTAFLGLAAGWRAFGSAVCAALALLSTAQLFSILLLHPYRLARPGTEQTVALTAPAHMAGLRVDADTHAFIAALIDQSQRAAGPMAGAPMLAMFDLAGVVYILDAVSVGYFWHYSGAGAAVICRRLRGDPNVKTTRVIALDRPLPDPIVDCLRQSGVDIAGYTQAADIPLAPRGSGSGRLCLLVRRD